MERLTGLLKVLLNPLTEVRILYANKDLLRQLVLRNIQSRYRGSVLGFLWSFVQPLMMLCVYTFVFSVIFTMRWGGNISDNRGVFAIVMFCGITMYSLFSESVNANCVVISSNPSYVKKVIFPLEILPAAQVISSFILGTAWFILLFLGAWLVFKEIHWTMLLLPLPLAALFLFALGIGWLVASLGVFLRDIQYIIGIILQILFFMTPIFYPISAVPEPYRQVLQFNPLTIMIEQTREIFLYGHMPNWWFILTALAVGAVTAHLGFVWFYKTKRGFADVL